MKTFFKRFYSKLNSESLKLNILMAAFANIIIASNAKNDLGDIYVLLSCLCFAICKSERDR